MVPAIAVFASIVAIFSVVLQQLNIKRSFKAREFGLFSCQSLCIIML